MGIVCLVCRLYDVYSFWYVVVLPVVCLRFVGYMMRTVFCVSALCFWYVGVLPVVCLRFVAYVMCTLFSMSPF